ncbi:MAG: alpha-ketoglutarate-dependent dioxygenase AlkB [Bacteroidota bacterium]
MKNQYSIFTEQDVTIRNIELQDGELVYIPNFYSSEKSKQIFNALKKEINWQQQKIVLFGKQFDEPRLSAWYAEKNVNYSYSGIQLVAQEFTPILQELKKEVEQKSNTTFNSVLLNLYRNGNDSMGWHADDEKELGINPIIASLNFGETRRFKLKYKTNKNLKFEIDLENGSLLIMQGALQHHWMHHIPKTKRQLNERINLTFRKVI